MVALVLLNWLATQLVAAALHYPPFFMGCMIGHFYQPFAWWWWQYHWPHNSVQIGHSIIPLTRAWSLCDRIVFYPLIALVVVGGLISGLLLKRRGPADLHGSAAVGRHRRSNQGGSHMVNRRGIYLATWPKSFGRRCTTSRPGRGTRLRSLPHRARARVLAS